MFYGFNRELDGNNLYYKMSTVLIPRQHPFNCKENWGQSTNFLSINDIGPPSHLTLPELDQT